MIKNMNKKQKLGIDGEIIVAQFLIKKNFKIIDKNYRTKLGEIDLIAQKNDTICFIEVKTRKKSYFPISNVITWAKQQKIIKAAQLFIIENKIKDKVCRFDVATVIVSGYKFDIEYLKNAFQEI
ncbi:YraN family protein [Candidatus Dependentiae bacterium]|nr:YraN family protein [Candidatus Dependentiae bacterium]